MSLSLFTILQPLSTSWTWYQNPKASYPTISKHAIFLFIRNLGPIAKKNKNSQIIVSYLGQEYDS